MKYVYIVEQGIFADGSHYEFTNEYYASSFEQAKNWIIKHNQFMNGPDDEDYYKVDDPVIRKLTDVQWTTAVKGLHSPEVYGIVKVKLDVEL